MSAPGAPAPGEADAILETLRVPAGLCAACAHLDLLRSPRSTFVRCGRAADDARFPRYPRLPMVDCPGFHRA